MELGIDIDYDLYFLERALHLVDSEGDRLSKQPTEDLPDDFYLEDMEYLTGFGFVACQAYATHALKWVEISKPEALDRGPMIECNGVRAPIIAVINATANCWKHQAEWNLDQPSPDARRSIQVLEAIGVNIKGGFPAAHALGLLLGPGEFKLSLLLPSITQWRNELHGR